jgi:hypothetical protein
VHDFEGPEQAKGWWARNWKWAAPAGCLSVVVVFAVGLVVAIAAIVFGIVKSSDAYKMALDKAKTDPAVVAALGSPISAGYFATGNIHVSGPTGTADLAIPISGPKGSATIYLKAYKDAGQWSFSKLVVAIDQTKEIITLVDGAESDKAERPIAEKENAEKE